MCSMFRWFFTEGTGLNGSLPDSQPLSRTVKIKKKDYDQVIIVILTYCMFVKATTLLSDVVGIRRTWSF